MTVKDIKVEDGEVTVRIPKADAGSDMKSNVEDLLTDSPFIWHVGKSGIKNVDRGDDDLLVTLRSVRLTIRVDPDHDDSAEDHAEWVFEDHPAVEEADFEIRESYEWAGV